MDDPAPRILKSSDLLPGDALLYRPRKPNWTQRQISKLTNSTYTHASIYLGQGAIAESLPGNFVFLSGVRKGDFHESLKNMRYIAVLRSQCGFSEARSKQLLDFVKAAIKRGKFYNVLALLFFGTRRDLFFQNQLEFIKENYGKSASAKDFSKRSFFCSAFVVACYAVVGIIDQYAQAAYQPNFFAPGALYKDPTFGWLVGFITNENESVPENDPAFQEAPDWHLLNQTY